MAVPSSILFLISLESSPKAVALVATEIATGRTRELFRGKFYPLGISLSPNGQQLAFGVGDFESLKQSIYVVGVDGSNLHPVLTNEVSRTLPGSLTGTTIVETWSPDGKELVFMTGGAPPTGPTTPYRLNVLSLKDGAVRVWKDLTPCEPPPIPEHAQLFTGRPFPSIRFAGRGRDRRTSRLPPRTRLVRLIAADRRARQ